MICNKIPTPWPLYWRVVQVQSNSLIRGDFMATIASGTIFNENDSESLRFQPSGKSAFQLLIIDTSVKDYSLLLNALSGDISVAFLNSNRDGVQQLTDILSKYHNKTSTEEVLAKKSIYESLLSVPEVIKQLKINPNNNDPKFKFNDQIQENVLSFMKEKFMTLLPWGKEKK